MLSWVRSIAVQAGVGVGVVGGRVVLGGLVASSLLLILTNDVFSGWSGGGRLVIHPKAVVPEKITIVSFAQRS